MKKIILTSGGTAGHVYPVISVAEALKRNARLKLIYVGSRSGPEKELAKKADLKFYGIVTGKRRAYFSFLNFIDFFKIIFGLVQSFFIFISFKPDLVFAKGGYVTFPVIFWAKIFKTRLIIHESDAVMGRTNLRAAKRASKICLGFPLKYFTKYNNLKLNLDKLSYTGIPLRKEFLIPEKIEKTSKPKILFTGGSQGSSKINSIVSEILPELLKEYEIYHISGERDFKDLKEKNHEKTHYHLFAYSDDIAQIMAGCDLIVARAGANTLMEISALQKPAILIPLPSSASNHQFINAKIYQDCNAAVVVNEKNLTSSSLLSIINRLMEDENLLRLLGHHSHEFFVPNATSLITDIIYEDK